ncbi:MAG TPA: leucine--tRNA ligase [Elusimicrobia bacterium]|nr:MAG: leucine--tRNA ligase [Elusimicrobia bacterium RIFOXYA12_FULL_49_49]OGS10991.1 MAG: leucine--tRNA ligase [Elusimicrobia bacterium RIFOXYB1_FULL_48_9]OGS15173.1 MAG: leucine--tRNA ligase [Elusimicrobia bacterium RIFOXYA2_FULL_47_53]OGS29793.1 MAG: leucine--tRNA ligase [Elusimicrobia bacterium RIFOXYB2_FULL_46_23]HBU70276.1 leucine--tRNA ligase [Elusimicrobiota bacterium]
MVSYNFAEIEKKWQKHWNDKGLFKADDKGVKPKYYCLVMFPYPSGKLHMGHVRNYVLGDVFARYYRMKGFNVLQPIGWDAFGLPAENAAIKNKIHPEKWTRENIKHMASQLKDIGISYDWNRELATCDEQYYRWNQWFFIKMWEKGLAYRKKARVNWCPSCGTVLANEQVNQGKCWRCDSAVEDRDLEQWFFKITQYSDELLSGHDELKDGWPEEVLLMQKNWIGKSTGAEIDFKVVSDSGRESFIKVFTTRPDTLFGATFMVIAPEHAIIKQFHEDIKNHGELDDYAAQAKKKSTIERLSDEKDKTGIRVAGLSAVNPVNNSKLPIFVSDYVLTDYGTGAIMSVPAHDQRDWDFAKKYNLPVVEVIHSKDSDISKKAYEGEGKMVNSGQFNGISSVEALEKVTAWVDGQKLGKKTVNFRLKDWLLSRQRYWGTPIPMIHCEKCGTLPVPEKELPVVLPQDIQITGKGGSPLAESASFVKAKCPKCGGKAKRETDTMDTFVDSSWYFARYCDSKNDKLPFSPELADKWMPVDQYVGGIEHACMHLIYSRFWFKVMRDLGLVKANEPFKRLLTQGMVTLGGSAMSKSKGNIVTQDEIISKYGADTARLFIMFAAPPEKQLEWSSEGVEGSWRFINRVIRLVERIKEPSPNNQQSSVEQTEAKKAANASLRTLIHRTIKKVTTDIEKEQQLNTAIAAVMELVNALYSYSYFGDDISKQAVETVVLLLAPFTPHVAEELWAELGHKESLLLTKWPETMDEFLKEENVELPVQINGKLRGLVQVKSGISEAELRSIIENEPRFRPYINSRGIKKFIYVPGKIVNLVAN